MSNNCIGKENKVSGPVNLPVQTTEGIGLKISALQTIMGSN
jgi:hypothetical protein